jgi:pseudouridine synthase
MADSSRPGPAKQGSGNTLVKYLVGAGLGSRRRCATLVMDGLVRVNGNPAANLTMVVGPKDLVEVEGQSVSSKTTSHVYLLLNKPEGYLSTVRDDRGRPTVWDLLPRGQRVAGVVPAGRLDMDTTGLMLMTDDGQLVNQITHPRYGVQKEYHARLWGVLSPTAMQSIRDGVMLETGMARATAIRRLPLPGNWYSVTLVEGKKREVRNLFRAVAQYVRELERVRIGSLTLGDLARGAVRRMTSAELHNLRQLSSPKPASPARARRSPETRRPTGPPHSGPRDRRRPGQQRRG